MREKLFVFLVLIIVYDKFWNVSLNFAVRFPQFCRESSSEFTLDLLGKLPELILRHVSLQYLKGFNIYCQFIHTVHRIS